MAVTTNDTTNVETDEINAEMIDYMTAHGKVSAKELSELVGITVSSIRYRLFQLMGCGIVGQEKTRNYRVWFFVIEKENGDRLGRTARQTRDTGDTDVLRTVFGAKAP